MANDKVLVTGGSGFLAGHCILSLLQAVIAFARTAEAGGRSGAASGAGGRRLRRRGPTGDRDLRSDGRCGLGRRRCRLHACPARRFAAAGHPAEGRGRADQTRPRRRLARAEGGASLGRPARGPDLLLRCDRYGRAVARPYDERDWTDTAASGLAAYPKSKTLAERAAWDFVDGEGRGLELAVVNPVGIFGPLWGRISPPRSCWCRRCWRAS